MVQRSDNFDHPVCPKKGGTSTPSSSHCVVLGGGGARGLAHLGAMRALGERNFQVSRIVGVSMGALIAGVCAVEGNVSTATERVLDYLNSSQGRKLRSTVFATGGASNQKSGKRSPLQLFRELKKRTAIIRALRSQSLLPSTVLRDAIDSVIPDVAIEDLATPLQIVTVDLKLGHRVVLNSGSLRRAIRASMSIPGVFPAVCHEGKRLGDIGVYDSVPCDIPADQRCVISGSEVVIAVDVAPTIKEQPEFSTAIETMMALQVFSEQKVREQSLANADFVIRPKIENTPWFDFSDPESIIEAGYGAGEKELGPPADRTGDRSQLHISTHVAKTFQA